MTTTEILNRGMNCLTETLGVIEAERFISLIMQEKFDYTQWQREYYDALPEGQFHLRALEYAKEHPYQGAAERV